MMRWGDWDQIDQQRLGRAWGRLLRDRREPLETQPQLSPLWILMSIGRQAYLALVGGQSILGIVDNLFLTGFALGAYYAQQLAEEAGIDRLTGDDYEQDGDAGR